MPTDIILIGPTKASKSTLAAHFVKHPSNYRLAKAIVYTEGKAPEQTVDEILARRTK